MITKRRYNRNYKKSHKYSKQRGGVKWGKLFVGSKKTPKISSTLTTGQKRVVRLGLKPDKHIPMGFSKKARDEAARKNKELTTAVNKYKVDRVKKKLGQGKLEEVTVPGQNRTFAKKRMFKSKKISYIKDDKVMNRRQLKSSKIKDLRDKHGVETNWRGKVKKPGFFAGPKEKKNYLEYKKAKSDLKTKLRRDHIVAKGGKDRKKLEEYNQIKKLQAEGTQLTEVQKKYLKKFTGRGWTGSKGIRKMEKYTKKSNKMGNTVTKYQHREGMGYGKLFKSKSQRALSKDYYRNIKPTLKNKSLSKTQKDKILAESKEKREKYLQLKNETGELKAKKSGLSYMHKAEAKQELKAKRLYKKSARKAMREKINTPPATVDAKATSVDAKATSVDAKATSVDAKATSVDAKATSVDAKATSVDAKATSVDAKAIVNTPPAASQ
jgi:hypothetical protein